jgi:hypothetical protein
MFAPMHGTCTNTTEAYLSSFLKTEASYLLLRYVQLSFHLLSHSLVYTVVHLVHF